MAGNMRHISVISRCAIQYRGERLASCGLNGSHIEYILNICRHPGVTQDQLAQIIHVNGSNVTRQLALLEGSGFVERRQSKADRRMVEVYPTQKAIDALPYVREVLRAWNEYLTAEFTEDDKAQLLRLLERMADRAEAYVADLKSSACCREAAAATPAKAARLERAAASVVDTTPAVADRVGKGGESAL